MKGSRKGPVIFKNMRRASCPACLDRNALNMIGRPLWDSGRNLSGGCEICSGNGRVTLVDVVGAWPPDDPFVYRVRKVKDET